MKVLITGVGDAFTELDFGSSGVVEGPEGLFLIDCPDLVHKALRQACDISGWKVDAMGIHDIVLTHLHGDHCNGLESYGFLHAIARIRGEGNAVPRIHTHRRAADRLWERLAPAMDAPLPGAESGTSIDDYFDVRVFEAGESISVAGCTIDTRLTRHPVPTIGLRISDGTRSLGWSGDTSFDPDHIAWLEHCDLIVHEVNVGPVHTHIDQLQSLPQELRAKMRLIHMPDNFDSNASDIRPLRAGEVLEL